MAGTIAVQGLSKRYRRYPTHRAMTIEETMLHGGWSRGPVEYMWALRDVWARVMPRRR